jgi:hypothetical protein
VRGQVARLAGQPAADVERRLAEALELARGRDARSLSMRAAASLAELLRDQDRSVPADVQAVLQDVS